MRRIESGIPGVILIEPDVFVDGRGFFLETYNKRKISEIGVIDEFVQDNHSKSMKSTLRGLHYQLKHPQAKLCRVVEDEVLDVVVDIRVGSPTFGKTATARLSAENRRQMYVPAGFAHGFLVISDTAEFLYKCSDFYHPEDERGLSWNDPGLAIDWGIAEPILSARDRVHPRLSEVDKSSLPKYSPE